MRILTEQLQETAAAFSLASRDSQEIMKRLEDAMAGLESKWSGATQQGFHKNYRDWQQYMGGMAALLKTIAHELEAMADRYQVADK